MKLNSCRFRLILSNIFYQRNVRINGKPLSIQILFLTKSVVSILHSKVTFYFIYRYLCMHDTFTLYFLLKLFTIIMLDNKIYLASVLHLHVIRYMIVDVLMHSHLHVGSHYPHYFQYDCDSQLYLQ